MMLNERFLQRQKQSYACIRMVFHEITTLRYLADKHDLFLIEDWQKPWEAFTKASMLVLHPTFVHLVFLEIKQSQQVRVVLLVHLIRILSLEQAGSRIKA